MPPILCIDMIPRRVIALAGCAAWLTALAAQTVSASPQQQALPSSPGQQRAAPALPGLVLTLADALDRARKNAQQYQSAIIGAAVAHEDRVQAKAALLPNANWFNQFIYTQPNRTPSGVFVPNDGPHVYANYAVVHGDLYAPGKRADYQRAIAAEAAARARADIAARGLTATVVQNYYALVAAQRKYANAEQSLAEARQFADITRKLETGGEAARSEVIKADIQVQQRQRDAQDASVAAQRDRIGFGVLLFADYNQDFSVEDDLLAAPALPARERVEQLAGQNNPDVRAAQATLRQQQSELVSSRAAYFPTLSFDYFYGIDANQYAIYNREHQRNLGSVAQATLNVPIWNWGATRSRVRQSELRLQQARLELSLTQRTLLANLNSFYVEAQAASNQIDSLRQSMDLSAESLRLTLLRYQSGEATVLEVVDAQTTLAQARNAYADGLVRYRTALADLQTLTGVF